MEERSVAKNAKKTTSAKTKAFWGAGAVVKAKDGQQPIAGGFVGYGDLGRIDNSSASNLKKVESDQVAGGFIGQTDMNYIVSAQVQSILLEAVLQIVNQLLEILYFV